MSLHTVRDAERFVASIDLTGVPRHVRRHFGVQPPRFIPRPEQDQSIVVGSQLQGFTSGVDEKMRRAIQNSVLLAQLVAQKQVPLEDDVAWYRTYFDVLVRIGWLIQEQRFSVFDGGAAQSDVHEALLQLAASLMGGPEATAYQIVSATIDALQKLQEGNPAITIFRRETQHQQSARFQLSVAEEDGDGGLSVSLMALRLLASTTLTQVVFFKFKTEEAHLEHFAAKVCVNQDVLERVADSIAEKVASYVDGFVRTLEI